MFEGAVAMGKINHKFCLPGAAVTNNKYNKCTDACAVSVL
jgi:hypothetical protein